MLPARLEGEVLLEVEQFGASRKLEKINGKKKSNINRRWAVERSYSIFKFFFGEKVRSRKWPYIVQEITLKITQMNHYLNELYDE